MRAALGSEHFVEAVGPVDTHHSDHGEEDTDAGTGASLEIERREVFHGRPGVTAFSKHEAIDCGNSLVCTADCALSSASLRI